MELSQITFRGPEIDDPEILEQLPGELRDLLRPSNGFIRFDGGLHVRGACRAPQWHSLRAVWLGERALHRAYPNVRAGDIPFAQDCVGDQFLWRDGRIHRLTAETGEVAGLCASLQEFFQRIDDTPIKFLSLQPLLRFEMDGGRLRPGELLSVVPPYCVGAEDERRSLRAIPAEERLDFLAYFAGQIANVPDGAYIQFEVSNTPSSPVPSSPVAPEIILEDGPLLAVNKPAGLLTLGAKPGVPTLERAVKSFLKTKYNKPGNVYLGIPHRLDRPVSGVVVFARNSKAAARLAEQFRERQVRKTYWAMVESAPDPPQGELVDWLMKVPDVARVEVVPAGTSGAREARLRYRTLSPEDMRACGLVRTETVTAADTSMPALLEIEPLTGRTHQIRVQLGARGWPIVGDHLYGATMSLLGAPAPDPRDEPIALHARALTILHPVRYDPVTIRAPLPGSWRRVGNIA